MVKEIEQYSTIHKIIYNWARHTPDAIAIASPGRIPLDYSSLWSHITRTAHALREWGIGRNDRVAIVIPQGAEMAVAFLAVSDVAIAAPLNPHLSGEDFASYLKAIDPKYIMVAPAVRYSIEAIAQRLDITIIEIIFEPAKPSGMFSLPGASMDSISSDVVPEVDDLGLILSTSGTTSRPKLVLLTHRNFVAAADNTQAALGLTQNDRCLDVMPLFHGHGLVAGVVASLIAGAAVMCTPPFSDRKFFAWMDEFRPTWYTAIPTMHQAVLAEAPGNVDIIDRTPLRFIRSASALLPLPIMDELERVFKVPVTESYGLSEALQLTNTPLDLTKRKIGSLGLPGTSDVGIMDEAGKLMKPGEKGEIVCRGPIVMQGYFNDPEATERSFTNGWFRTGDLGYLDTDGHLYMTGRLKETINKGGEKVSPQEVDSVIMSCPTVSQAVTFGIPDPVLGEEVAAVVAPKTGMSVSGEDIRRFVATKLSEYKVPTKVLVVPKILTGPTGKLIRREVAQHFGPIIAGAKHGSAPVIEARNPLERQLIHLWEDLLSIRPLGIRHDFFDCGGTSLLAVRMMEEIERFHGKTLHPSVLFSAPTIEQLSHLLQSDSMLNAGIGSIIEIQGGQSRRPLFFLNGIYHGGGFYCRELAGNLHPEQPFYTFSPLEIEKEGIPNTIESQAESYLNMLPAIQSSGPYLLGGFSHAGLIAYEMARRLRARGEEVALLVIVDMPAADSRLRFLRAAVNAFSSLTGAGREKRIEHFFTWRYRFLVLSELYRYGMGSLIKFIVGKLVGKEEWHRVPSTSSYETNEFPDDEQLRRLAKVYTRMIEQYIPGRYEGRVTLFTSAEGPAKLSSEPTLGWGRVAKEVKVIRVPGNHLSCITEHVKVLAQRLQICLDEVQN